LREQVSSLQSRCLYKEKSANIAYRNLLAAQEKLQEVLGVIASVCKYSVALEPTEIYGDFVEDRFTLAVTGQEAFSYRNFDPLAGPANVRFEYVNCYELKAYLEEHHEIFSKAVHLEHSSGGHSAYMLSKEAMRSAPVEFLVNRIAPDIARMLVQELRGGRR